MPDFLKGIFENENTSPIQPKRYVPKTHTSSYKSSYESKYKSTYKGYGFNQDLQTSDGLYNLAQQAGLKDKADEIVVKNTGEDINKIYSGGWISDIMDTLNVTSYGVVGMLKGQSFMDGVKNRESFSDKDSLGQYGLGGVIAGLALDIVTDPLTYIAPWTLAKKIPGVIRVADKVTDVVAGRNVITEIAETGVSVAERKGGLLSPLFEKTVWMAGADPVFRETYEKSMMYHAGAITKITNEVLRPIQDIAPNNMKELFARDQTGRIFRRSNDDLSRVLDKDTFAKVAKANDAIDEWGQKLVDVGLLSKEKFDEGLGEYVKQTYREIELAKTKGFFGFAKNRITPQKARVEGMTPEQAKKLDLIDDPAVVYSTTLLKMVNDYHNAKLFKDLVPFSSSKEVEGFVQLADTARFNFNVGYESAIKKELGTINKSISVLEKEINTTFDADKSVLSEMNSIKKELAKIEKLQGEELNKFLNDRVDGAKEVNRPFRHRTIPDNLQLLANKIKKFDSFEDMINTRTGIELESKWYDGVLERSGFPGEEKAMRDFFELVKKPYREASTGTSKELKTVQQQVDEFESKLQKYAQKKLDKFQEKEFAKLKKQYDYAVKRVEKLKKQPHGRMSSKTDLETTDKIARVDGLMKNTKFGKEAYKQMEILKKKILASQNRSAKERDKMMKEIDSELQSFEDKLVDVKSKQLVEMQKRIEELTSKSKTLSEIDKRSINDSFRSLESNLNKQMLEKEARLDALISSKEGALAGKWVPKHIADMIDEKINPSEPFGSTVVAAFKYGNVVMSPAAFVRNAISNKILNYWKLGIGPWRADLDRRAYKAMNNPDDKYWKMASELGMGEDTYFSSEISNIINNQKTSFFTGSGKKYIEKAARKVGDWYQAEETHSKMVAFIKHIDDGFSPEEAMKAAHSATFNYAQVTPFIRKVRQSLFGVPFITFAMKAAPVSIETAALKPGRISVFGKIKNAAYNAAGVSEEEVQKEMENAPPWVKEGFYTRLWDDEHGRTMYFDWTYIIPFGAIIDGSLVRQDMEQQTGLPESPAVKLVSNLPAVNLIGEIYRNETFSGKKIWRDSDDDHTKMKDLTRHIIRMFAPPPAKNFINEGYDKRTGEPVLSSFEKASTADKDNIRRNFEQEIAKNFGFKIQPIQSDVTDAYREWNMKTGLQTMLQEQTGLQMFNIPYMPKK